MRKTSNYNLTLYDKTDKLSITAEENSLNANIQEIDKVLAEKATKNYVSEEIAKAQLGGDDSTVDLSAYATKDDLNSKQDKLISGTNIKTINGIPVIGSGNIKIEGTGEGGTTQAINYDLNVKAVNHRGYSAEAPENTIPAYIMSKNKGFTYVECDVSFTSDGVAVLLHDDTINRTSNGTGKISSITYEKVLTYDFGSWFNEEHPEIEIDYTGVKIPTFTEFITLCKRLGLHPYIELKSNGSYTQAQITQIVNEVEACGMKGKVTYISFAINFLKYVKNADASARLGYLASTLNDTAITNTVSLKTTTNEVFMDAKLANVTESFINSCISNGLPLEVWTVNTEDEIKEMPSYVSGVTSDMLVAGKILYEEALVYTPPTSNYVPATSITLDKNTLTFETSDTQKLTATVEPSDTTEKIVWKSSNDSVATVVNGVVTPITDGNCTITATVGSFSATCSVNVDFAIKQYAITKNLTNCTGSNNNVIIAEGATYAETFTANSGYTLEGGTVSVMMGAVDITSNYVDGKLTINSVTDNIVITITAVRLPAVVNLALANVTGDTIINNGSGGTTYNASITKVNSTDSYSSDENGLSLINHAYANIPYGFKASDKFTISVRGKYDEISDKQYQRLFRTDQDMPSIFYSHTSGSGLGAKLAGVTDNFTTHNDIVSTKGVNNASLNTAYIKLDNIDIAQDHLYTFVGDGSKIYYYIDGELMASQNASPMKTSTLIGMGDNDSTKTYYASKITISEFKIFNYAMTSEEVAELVN